MNIPVLLAATAALRVTAAAVRDAGRSFVGSDQDASRYFNLHHSADAALDKVDPAELAQNVAVWTSFLYTVADSDFDFRKLAMEAK